MQKYTIVYEHTSHFSNSHNLLQTEKRSDEHTHTHIRNHIHTYTHPDTHAHTRVIKKRRKNKQPRTLALGVGKSNCWSKKEIRRPSAQNKSNNKIVAETKQSTNVATYS